MLFIYRIIIFIFVEKLYFDFADSAHIIFVVGFSSPFLFNLSLVGLYCPSPALPCWRHVKYLRWCRTIYPSVLKILFNSSTKGDVRVCAVEVVRSLQTNLGRAEKVWLWSDDPHQQEELKKITANV